MSDLIDDQLKSRVSKAQTSQMMFVFTGNDPSKLLAQDLAACTDTIVQRAVGVRVTEHQDFIKRIYERGFRMASTPETIAGLIAEAAAPGFRDDLLAKGQARSMIWREGNLPDGAPDFSALLSYDLMSFAYSMLSQGLRLLEVGGNPGPARVAFEHAASAIEAVVTRGDGSPNATSIDSWLVPATTLHVTPPERSRCCTRACRKPTSATPSVP